MSEIPAMPTFSFTLLGEGRCKIVVYIGDFESSFEASLDEVSDPVMLKLLYLDPIREAFMAQKLSDETTI